MRYAAVSLALLLICSSGACRAANDMDDPTLDAALNEKLADPVSVALEWLAALDGAEYEKAWEMTTEEYRNNINIAFYVWAAAIKETRVLEVADATRTVQDVHKSKRLPDFGLKGQFVTVFIVSAEPSGEELHDTVVLVWRDSRWMVLGNDYWRKRADEE